MSPQIQVLLPQPKPTNAAASRVSQIHRRQVLEDAVGTLYSTLHKRLGP